MWGAVSTAWCDWGFSSRRCPNSGGRMCFIIIGFHLLQRIPPSGRQRWDKAAWTNRHIVVGLQTSHFVVLKFIPTKFKVFFSLKAFNHLIYWVVITGWFSSRCSSSSASSGDKSRLVSWFLLNVVTEFQSLGARRHNLLHCISAHVRFLCCFNIMQSRPHAEDEDLHSEGAEKKVRSHLFYLICANSSRLQMQLKSEYWIKIRAVLALWINQGTRFGR